MNNQLLHTSIINNIRLIQLQRLRNKRIRLFKKMEIKIHKDLKRKGRYGLLIGLKCYWLKITQIKKYWNESIGNPSHMKKQEVLIDHFKEAITLSKTEKINNPIFNISDSATYYIKSEKVRNLQAKISKKVLFDWYGIQVNNHQLHIISSFSNLSWIIKNLYASAGVPLTSSTNSNQLKKMKIVMGPYIKSLEIKCQYLEGLMKPGRYLVQTGMQKIRSKNIRRRLKDNDVSILYPEELDKEIIEYQKNKIISNYDNFQKKLYIRNEGWLFQHYLSLQSLIIDGNAISVKKQECFESYLDSLLF